MSRLYPLALLVVLGIFVTPAQAQDAVALRAATVLGGGGVEEVAGVAVAPDGTVYAVGTTTSANFPVTLGAFDVTVNGTDAFVARFSADLTTLLAATFVGGTGADEGLGLAVTSDGVYLVGTTAAPDFPATPGAFDASANGDEDAFAARLSPDLSTLLAATYLGGADEDRGLAVALDGTEVVVAGFAASADFPFSAGAFSTDPGPRGGPFVARLSADLATRHAATALGDKATVNALAVDATTGDVVIAGYVTGEDYPATPGAYDETCGADGLCDLWGVPGASHRKGDGFVSRLDRDLSTLLASTFLGHWKEDAVEGIVLHDGEVIVAGGTQSVDLSHPFPTTPGAFQTTSNQSSSVGFVSRFDGALTTLQASTVLAGGHLTEATLYDLHVDPATERVYAVGYATSNNSYNFPITPDAFASSERGVDASVLAVLSHSLSTLVFSSGFGGHNPTGNMRALALAAGPQGALYLAGFGGFNAQDDFPSTPRAFRRTAAGGRDGYVARVNTEGPVRLLARPTALANIPANGGSFDFTVTLENTTDQPQTVQVWSSVVGPAFHGRVLPPKRVTLAPGATLTHTATQEVPATAPHGYYSYLVHAGTFPGGAVATSYFTPIKSSGGGHRTAGVTASGTPEDSWRVRGWDDSPAAAMTTLPAATRLDAASPNPARDRATISYALAESAQVRLAVYDVLGREVAVLVDGPAEAGTHAVALDAARLPAGTYLVRLDASDFRQTRRLTVVR